MSAYLQVLFYRTFTLNYTLQYRTKTTKNQSLGLGFGLGLGLDKV